MDLKMRFGRLIPLFFASVAVAEDAVPQLILVEPVVGLAQGEVRQCGVRMAFLSAADGPLDLVVVLERAAAESVLAVRLSGIPPQSTIAIAAAQTLPRFQPVQTSKSIELRAPANDPAATDFLRQTMVSGLTVELRIGATVTHLSAAGLMPQSVRASYLNCAGDLYRPSE